jgi:hypothetical protein
LVGGDAVEIAHFYSEDIEAFFQLRCLYRVTRLRSEG